MCNQYSATAFLITDILITWMVIGTIQLLKPELCLTKIKLAFESHE